MQPDPFWPGRLGVSRVTVATRGERAAEDLPTRRCCPRRPFRPHRRRFRYLVAGARWTVTGWPRCPRRGRCRPWREDPRPRRAVRFVRCDLGPSACTSGDRLSRPAAAFCSRQRSAGSSSSSPSRPAISASSWRPGGSLLCCWALGAARSPIASICTSSSWSLRRCTASWPQCCGGWPPRARPAWRPSSS
jgi:hypothetical protein